MKVTVVYRSGARDSSIEAVRTATGRKVHLLDGRRLLCKRGNPEATTPAESADPLCGRCSLYVRAVLP